MSRALAHAANWFGIVCIAGAITTMFALAFYLPEPRFLIAAATLLPMGALLVALSVRRTVTLSLCYLLVGGFCTFVYALTLLSNPASFPSSDLFIVALPKMALVMVGGAGSGALLGVLWTSAGFVIAELATVAAALLAGSQLRADVTTLVTYVLLVALLLFDGLTRRTARVAQPAMHLAAREDRTLELRRELELRAAAHLHDTALSELILIAESQPGALDKRLVAQIGREITALSDRDWLVGERQNEGESPGGASAEASSAWQASAVAVAVEDARARGLTIRLSGDPDAVRDLDPSVDRAVGQALGQCFINVLRHAGVTEADVSIVVAPEDLTVIVVDDGLGFDVSALLAEEPEPGHPEHNQSSDGASATASQGIGLRHSVRGRIEAHGGTVEIWSRPGVGTSVMMSVPWARSTGSVSAEVGR
ncbi:MAG TPA: ATP-binding protein [Microterricola sp.]